MNKLNKNQESALKIANMRSEKTTFTTIKAGETGCGFVACKQLAEMGYLEVASIRQHRGVGWDTWYRITESGKAALGISDEPQLAVAVETPAAQNSEYQPEVGDVVSNSKYGRGVVVNPVVKNEPFRTEVQFDSLTHTMDMLTNSITLVERPTSAAVAITDDSAANNTPSEPKREIEQPSADFIQEGDTVKFFNDNNEVVSGEVKGFTSTGQLIIRYNGGQVRRHRMGVIKVNPQPSASEPVLSVAAYDALLYIYNVERGLISVQACDSLTRAGLITPICMQGSQWLVKSNDAGREYVEKYLLAKEVQPVSGWVADALATVDVTTEAVANDDYLPPTVDDFGDSDVDYAAIYDANDDLLFSDLGEDDIDATDWAEGDKVQAETIASLEARVRKLESIIQSANSLAYQLRSSLYPIVDSNTLAILCDIDDLTRKDAIS